MLIVCYVIYRSSWKEHLSGCFVLFLSSKVDITMSVVDFAILFIAFVLFGLCISLIFMMSQIMRAIYRIETFIDHLDREVVPAVRQIEHITKDLDEMVRNANRQILKVEPSLDIVRDVAEDMSAFKEEVLNKTNRPAILGAIAAFVSILKGKDLYDRYIKKNRH